MRHCLACEVSGAPSGCVWSVRGTVCLGFCKWVSVRLWGVRVCVSESRSVPGVRVCESSEVCVWGWVPLSGVWGPFVSRCLEPGFALVGLAQRWIPSMCVIV